jgi:hypothetical protein
MCETISHDPAGKVIALEFRACARHDFRLWMLLIVGLAFAYGGYTIDPRSNCGENGECAPWLVPVALVMGLLATMAALSQLIVNPRRGSYVDVAAGELVWWQGLASNGCASDAGRLPLARIARVRIVSDSDSADDVFLYDHDGQLLPFAGNEVIRSPYAQWASGLAKFCPGIIIDEE